MEKNQPVFFFGDKSKNGYLSNFYKSPFTLDEKEWQTVEHYFQA